MSLDEQLASVVLGLEDVGLRCLVMGGHAVRYYGLTRHTDDFDLCLAPEHWDELPQRLARSRLFGGAAPVEGPSWRIGAFRRFELGRLPDGRELWLEFWKENHLLAPFEQLHDRREEGIYGGSRLAFLSLHDLIRSKETERGRDWDDRAILVEFLDARNLAAFRRGERTLTEAMAQLGSRRGLESFEAAGLLSDPDIVTAALLQAADSINAALLLPFAPLAVLPPLRCPLESAVEKHLRKIEPLSRMHLGLVEAARNQYVRFAQALDKADKEATRQQGQNQPRP